VPWFCDQCEVGGVDVDPVCWFCGESMRPGGLSPAGSAMYVLARYGGWRGAPERLPPA